MIILPREYPLSLMVPKYAKPLAVSITADKSSFSPQFRSNVPVHVKSDSLIASIRPGVKYSAASPLLNIPYLPKYA